MKRKILVILTLALLSSACTIKNGEYYDEVATIAISFFQTDSYDKSRVSKSDRLALDEYLSSLTHVNQKVNVSDYIDIDLPTNEPNTNGVAVIDGNCYLDYAVIKAAFDKVPYSASEPSFKVSCNGYYAILHVSDFNPQYSYTQNNPEHNYILIDKYKEENARFYIYKSTYNGKGLMLAMQLDGSKITKITAKTVNADDYL